MSQVTSFPIEEVAVLDDCWLLRGVLVREVYNRGIRSRLTIVYTGAMLQAGKVARRSNFGIFSTFCFALAESGGTQSDSLFLL